MLPAVFGLLSPLLPVPLTIILTAVVTYCLSFVISRLIGKLPFGKYIVGWKGYSRSWLTKYASRIARSLVALQDDGMEVFDLWVQRISSSETLCFEDEISILPVSSSKKGLNEDETGAGRLFTDAEKHILPKCCRGVFYGVWLSASYAYRLSQLWQNRRFLWQSLWQNQTRSRRVFIDDALITRVKEKKGLFSVSLRLVKIM